ncbi:hypothetical protein L873DRAFT_976042 [Choiromyces venosus 120613-1]|uniref:Transmembrane protein n=1 Tax=Choiromyces venosus 120613-1 TaxID=1336337 RepID=A0A3N4JLH9_9PEZI|nr:hypothetical protein L873DRAFT_976042 [Choiromyces venosus 120613-1]
MSRDSGSTLLDPFTLDPRGDLPTNTEAASCVEHYDDYTSDHQGQWQGFFLFQKIGFPFFFLLSMSLVSVHVSLSLSGLGLLIAVRPISFSLSGLSLLIAVRPVSLSLSGLGLLITVRPVSLSVWARSFDRSKTCLSLCLGSVF